MAVDIAPELLLKIQTDFQKSIEQSARIKELYNLLKAGKATYKEASEYAELIGDFLAAAFKKHIYSDALPDGRLYFNIADRVIRNMLESDHKLVTDFAAEVQAVLNKQAGISIKPVAPKINEDYMKAIIERVSVEPRFDDVAWALQEPITNFSMATVDDAVRENAGLHYKAGLSPKIIRTTTGTPCKWCASLAGTYDYAKTPKIVFKRHNYCKCLIEYNPQDGAKRIDVHTRKEVGTDEEKEARIQMYENDKKELAKEAEKRRLARIELVKQKRGELPKTTNTANTLSKQFADTPAMNEYDYFSFKQEQFRLKSIQELAEVSEPEARQMLKALCGTSDEYKGIGNNVPTGWFSGSDTDIRASKGGEFFEKAKIIDSYIEKSPKYQGSIYRGLALSDELINQFKEGGTFIEIGNLSSWTSDKSVSQMFANARSEELGTRKVIIQTSDHPNSTPVAHLSLFGNEECEVLVSNMKNNEYLIQSVVNEDGYVHIMLELKG